MDLQGVARLDDYISLHIMPGTITERIPLSPPDEPSDPMQIAYVALVMWAKWLEWKLLGTRCGGQIVRARSNSRILASRYICMYMVTGFFSFFNSTRDWAD